MAIPRLQRGKPLDETPGKCVSDVVGQISGRKQNEVREVEELHLPGDAAEIVFPQRRRGKTQFRLERLARGGLNRQEDEVLPSTARGRDWARWLGARFDRSKDIGQAS